MAKPSRDAIQNGLNGWDGDVNNNFIRMMDNPMPVFLHTGNEANLEASYPAAAHEECLVMLEHTVLGLQAYMVHLNHPSGSAKWVLMSALQSEAPIVRNTASTLDWDDRKVFSNPAGAIALALRPAGEVAGKTINIKNLSAFVVTVDATGVGQIDGVNTFLLSVQFSAVTLYSDGATYHVL